jgi:large subunit ribosomal protein L4
VTATIDLLDREGGKAGTLELPAEIFDVQVNVPLIHQVVVGQLAAARQGTHATKSRGQVRGGGAKPYRQKGTGRARQGSRRAPQFAGGGVVHGPQPRSYAQRTPKKMKAAALRGALSDRARHGRVHVVTTFVEGDVPSTKQALATLRSVTDRDQVLVVLDRTDAVGWLSLRNLPEVHLIAADQLNTYDVLTSDDVVFTTRAYEDFTGAEVTVEKTPTKKAAANKSAGEGAAKKTTAKTATAKKATAKKSADSSGADADAGEADA